MNQALRRLRRDFSGDIIRPGASEYEVARRVVFATGHPAYVLRPRTNHDVQVGVRFANEQGRGLAVRGGGHGFSGFGTNDGGVVVDLRELNGVEVVDPARLLVRIGGGATWGEVSEVLGPRKLAISAGDTKSVGVGGLALTGGIGWKVRKYGLALDNVVAADVVLADGTVVRARRDENSDLFWAIRGGGGNFGVITAFEFVAHHAVDMFYGKVVFSPSEAREVLSGWADYLRSAPDELTSTVNLTAPVPGITNATIEIQVAIDSDDPGFVAETLAPIRGLGAVVEDDVALVPYDNLLEDGGSLPPGFEVVTRSGFVERPSVATVMQVLAETMTVEGAPAVGLRSVSGAASRVPADATAYAHRHAELMVVTLSAGPTQALVAARPTLEALWERLAPQVSGVYANFHSSAAPADVAAIYPRDTLNRLAHVKYRYDPKNLFAGNHNVRPTVAGSGADIFVATADDTVGRAAS